MTEEEILKKAIERADKVNPNWYVELHKDWHGHEDFIGVYEIIFSHSFAKALFGIGWAYSLSHMVTWKEPLKFIEKFMEDAP